MKKKILFLLLLLLIPLNVKGLEYSFGNITNDEQGKATVELKVASAQSETISDSLNCSATNGINCKIEAVSPYTMDGTRIEPHTAFTDGDVIAKLVLSNTTYNDVSTDIVLKYGDSTLTPITVKVLGLEKPLSNDTTIKTLTTNVGEFDPKFDPNKSEYTIYGIADSVSGITFTHTCDACSVKYEGGSRVEGTKVYLNNGENKVKLIVTAQNQTDSRTYTFNVIKGESSYNSSRLKSLTVGQYELDPKFESAKLEYTVKIPKKLSNIESLLDFKLEDEQATSKVEGAATLENDENEVKITVTARDGKTTIYVLKVIKEDDVQAVIDVIGYKDKKVTFIDTEGNSTTLPEEEFKEQYPDEWTKIDDGTYKFDEDGNIIRESNEPEKKEEKKKSSFPWIIVILIVLAIAIISVAGYFIFRDPEKAKNKKNKKDKKGKEDDEEDEESEDLPTDEEQEHLDDIDSYNEEARLIAEDNLRKEDAKNTMKDEESEEDVEEESDDKEDKEEVVREETIDEYVEDEEEKSPTMDIDEALSDLMNTKEYNFKDK